MSMTLARRGAMSLLLTAALAACGGGGGGDDLPAGVTGDLTSGNYAAAGNTAAGTTINSLDAISLFLDDGSAAATSARSRAAVQRLTQRRLTAATAADRREGALAIEVTTEACEGGGSLTYTDDYATASTVTPGDTLSVVANNCVVDGETVTGSFLITVVRYVLSSTAVDAGFTLAFNNFGSTTERLNGSANIDVAATQTREVVTLRYQGLTATFDGASVEWRHTVEYSASTTQAPQVVLSGLVQVGSGFVALRQVSPYTLAQTGYPSAGILELTGANGGRVRLVAGSTRFHTQFFAPGNSGSTPDASTPGRLYVD